MNTLCRISMRVGEGPAVAAPPRLRILGPELSLLADSKSVNAVDKGYVERPNRLTPWSFEIGRERAFTDVPATFKVVRPNAARRKL